jgi:hypothetical protein
MACIQRCGQSCCLIAHEHIRMAENSVLRVGFANCMALVCTEQQSHGLPSASTLGSAITKALVALKGRSIA